MKWYIVRTVTGKEKKSKEYLDIEIERLKMSSYIAQVLVPTERVIQIRNGKKSLRKRISFQDTLWCKRLLKERLSTL